MISSISSSSASHYASATDITRETAAAMHQKTGAPLYACKRALALSGNNMPAALTMIAKASPEELLSGQFAPTGSQTA